ncbi:uncharacterized protein LOC113535751 isoform X1 [Pangasianodon hypophthalmus]|nr:uncharacterized protein LOC113535751 isoform X1 [Pangasianodon hypophthalmus]XP_053096350.1 uncharacterized protein LOC113535751 isoform X1 [Pangasianodon hypophthalmus]XP_053096351.1 uncharacterized protein LOC113535751 isoform X1 [Pangasianodon hypophthalmus]
MSVNLPLSVKDIVTPSARDVSQDCTSMIMPSGVSSFLLDCMDSDLEAGEPLPSIETLCKADTYDEGTGLISEDEMLHCYIKNSTLLSFSDAVNIGMQHPPNLSSILELSPVIDGKIAKESFSLPPSQPVSPLGSSPLVGPCEYLTSPKNTSGGKSKTTGVEERTPITKIVVTFSPVVKKKPLTGKQPIKCRKVTFSDVIRTQAISVLNPSSVKPQRRAYNVHKNDMRRNTKERSLQTARFFDFADECEKEAFFQRLKLTYTFQLPAKLITFTDLPKTEDV